MYSVGLLGLGLAKGGTITAFATATRGEECQHQKSCNHHWVYFPLHRAKGRTLRLFLCPMVFAGFFRELGSYLLLLKEVFKRPEKSSIFRSNVLKEIDLLGLSSIYIVTIISLFVGGVVTIQTALNLENPLIPRYYIAIATRESIVLEFSPTMISLILAGKVGSNIASTLGTMRVSEQIDALEVMGINPASFLILPKVIASVLFNPILIGMSMFLGILGGYIAGVATDMTTSSEFIMGLQMAFKTYYVWYALFKTVVFAFLIATISSFYGYTVKGGAVEVGIAGTRAVVTSSLAIIVANYILTQILLG
jgi:phospholipid/cholesterol/gamma-HCH transport system permease protein